MALEIQLEELKSTEQEDLEKADIWSLGLLMYSLINPNLPSPCRGKFEQAGIPSTVSAMKNFFEKKTVAYVFIIDTSKLLDVADVKCDDLRAWHCTGSPKSCYSIEQEGN